MSTLFRDKFHTNAVGGGRRKTAVEEEGGTDARGAVVAKTKQVVQAFDFNSREESCMT